MQNKLKKQRVCLWNLHFPKPHEVHVGIVHISFFFGLPWIVGNQHLSVVSNPYKSWLKIVKWWLGCIITSETKGFRFYWHSQKVIGFVWICREYVVEHAKTELSETICLTLLWHTMTWHTACVYTSLQVWICNHGTKQRTWLDRKLPTPRGKDQTHSIQHPAFFACQR